MADHIEYEAQLSSHNQVSNSAQSFAIGRSSPQHHDIFYMMEKNPNTSNQEDWNKTKAE
jgi:hypothetical protein